MRILSICIFFFFIGTKAYAQDNHVIGNTIDSLTKRSIKDAKILLYKQESLIGSYLTDTNGVFKIPLKLYLESSHLKISCVDYNDLLIEKSSKSIDKLSEDILLGTIELKPKIILLKEVVVKERKRYSDTTNIDLSNEKFEREFMIDDLFSKKMGFSREGNELYYKGRRVLDVVVNGGDFFGKNNMDIYKNLPALVLNNIEIVETDIDSLTNVTLLNPAIKVNLKLKDKYKSGKFGNGSLGIGTLKRYVISTDLYTYKKSEQISLILNSNNINANENAGQEPVISFSANGNNTINHNSRVTYRNVFFKDKIEFNALLNGKIGNTESETTSERRDELLNQFSNMMNSSSLKKISLDVASFNLNYKINTLNTLRINQAIEYFNIKQNDSLNYNIRVEDLTTSSLINKRRTSSTELSTNRIEYQRQFSSKKGRLMNFYFSSEKNKQNVSEDNRVTEASNDIIGKSSIEGDRQLIGRTMSLNGDFNEPLGDAVYIRFLIAYKRERFSFNTHLTTDSVMNDLDMFSNDYLKQGIKIYKTLNKLALDGTITSITNIRNFDKGTKTTLWNVDAAININYKLSKKRKLFAQYNRTTNYPSIDQLTSINNSFDIISQQQGNPNLKPEIKNRLEFNYDLKKTDSLSLGLIGSVERYTSKFGANISSTRGAPQTIFIDNIGSIFNGELAFSFAKNLGGKSQFNYRLGLVYQEMPSYINQIMELRKSISINQSVSTNKMIIENVLSISPTVSLSYSKYSFQKSTNNQLNLTYMDRVTLNLFKFQFTASPFVNYSYSINKNISFATNIELKRNFLKNYGSVWLKAYDVFNSFSYLNNFVTASYTQSIKYSNVGRYFLVGTSIKFNNIK